MVSGLPIRKRLGLVARFVGHSLYPYQVAYVLTHNDPTCRGDVWNKGRQTGLTTVALADMAVEALVREDYLANLLSFKQEKSNRLLRRLKACYRRVGRAFYKEIVAKENESELVLANGANILALSGAASDARSDTLDQALCDEFAFVEEQGALLTALNPALARKGRLTIVTTPNGPGDVFQDYHTNAEKFGLRAFTVPWWLCPDLSPEYMEIERERLAALGKSFEQEYECAFVQTASSLFDWPLLKKAEVDVPVTKAGKVILGWDPARDRDSSGVIALRIEAGHKEVIGIFDLSRMPYTRQVERIKEIQADYGAAEIRVDAFAQGDPIADFLGRRTNVVREKMKRDDNRAAAAYIRYEMERGKFTISPVCKLRRQLLQHLNTFDNEKGRFPYKKHSGHADLGSALLLAWQAVPRKPRRRAREFSREIRRRGSGGMGSRRRRAPWYALESA